MRTRLLYLVVALAACPAVTAQRYSFRYYSHPEGLENLVVYSVAQAPAGFLWVGTANGLYRYDGWRFSGYGVAQGLPDHRIVALHVGPDGTLWIGTKFGLARRRASFQVVNKALRFVSPSGIASDSSGKVYFGTDSGLFQSDGKGKWLRIGHPASAGGIAVSGVHVDSDHAVWFGCGERLCRLGQGAVEAWGPEHGVPPDRWDAIQRDRPGNLWIRSSTRLAVLKRGSVGFEVQSGVPRASRFGSIFMDSAGVLIVPTELGLMRRGGAGWERIGIENGLPTNATSCLMQDREGSLWVGMSGVGLARWIGYGEWRAWTHADGLMGSTVRAAIRTRDGTVWAGTECGLHMRPPDGSGWKTWTESEGLAGNRVRAIAAAPGGALWVGSESGGLTRVDPATGALRPFLLPGNYVRRIFTGPGERLWVLTESGVFTTTDAASPAPRFERVVPPQLRPDEAVSELLVDGAGRPWLAVTDSVLVEEGGVWRRYRTHQPETDGPVTLLANAPDGSVWAAAEDSHAVFRIFLRDGAIRKEQAPSPNFHHGEFSAIQADGLGRLWVTTDNGVEVFDGARWARIHQGDGLLWDDCVSRSLWIAPDNSVWIGTSQGLSIYTPPSAKAVPPAPPILISSVRSGNRRLPGLGPAQIANGGNGPLEFRFAAPTFLNEAAVRFQYRLEGLDETWRTTDQRAVQYAHLSPGQYTFEVQARNARGRWSQSARAVRFCRAAGMVANVAFPGCGSSRRGGSRLACLDPADPAPGSGPAAPGSRGGRAHSGTGRPAGQDGSGEAARRRGQPPEEPISGEHEP